MIKSFLIFLLIFLVDAKRVAKNQGSSEVEGDRTSVPDKFDQPSYGFMLPEGYSENSTLLAVVDFITRRDNPTPKIVVNFDELGWFDIGGVQKTKADNADVYSATVILKPHSDVKIDQTDDGIYKFVVEAQLEDNVLATTNVVVEVLALSSTTKRVKVVEEPIEISNVELEPVDEIKSEMETSTSSGEVTTSDTTRSEEETSTTSDDATTSETSETDVTEPSTTTSQPEIEISTIATTPETALSEEETSTESGEATSSETSEPEFTESSTTTSQPESVTLTLATTSDTTEATTSQPDIAETSTLSQEEASATTETSTSESTTSFSPEDSTTTETSTPSEDFLEASGTDSTDDFTTESSGELLTDESPLNGPVTILPLSTDNDPIDLELELRGSLQINSYEQGDQIRGFSIVPRSRKLVNEEVSLSCEPEGLSIRPKVLRIGEEAGIFISEMFNTSKNYEIVARLSSGATIRQPLNFDFSSNFAKNHHLSEKYLLREIEFLVDENVENGHTIGKIDDNSMRIISDHQQRFTLLGDSIILTCNQFDTEKCLENGRDSYNLMLLPKNNTLAPFQITIRVQKSNRIYLRTSDRIIRVSDNRIIQPFVIFSNVEPTLSGSASKFLGSRRTGNMWQIQVINSVSTGKYDLEIMEKINIPVFVENSQSHARFRKPKYSTKLDSSKIVEGKRLVQVELEGVPIDEAKIVIIDGNPGWVTVEGYGGRVKVNSYNGNIYSGKYTVRIGAIDKTTFDVLTETEVEIEVMNGEEKIQPITKVTPKFVEITFDREKDPNFEIPLDGKYSLTDTPFAIDENGKRINYEPMNLKITKSSLKIGKVDQLRLISFNIQSDTSKVLFLIRLVSSPAFLERQEKLRSKPIYSADIMEINMNEEMKKGSVVGVFPAVIPTTNQRTSSRIEGDMKEAFDFDEQLGELKIRKMIDYESLKPEERIIDLKLISGEIGFETEAIIRIHVVDIDDNSPIITRDEINTVSLPEDLLSGSKIAEFDVKDPDGSTRFDVELDGRGSGNYFANVTSNGVLSIFLASDGKLDREMEESNSLIVKVSDVSGNSDRILIPIQILDVNDNAPTFDRKVYEVEAVENWPTGVVIEKIQANDADLNKSGEISYFVEGNPNVLKINKTSGILSIGDDLMGLSRDEPYTMRIIAKDSGSPSLNSSVLLNLKIRSKDELMSQPIVEFVNFKHRLEIEENISDSEKIAKIEAHVKGSSEHPDDLEYSLKDLTSSEQSFEIDKTTGDIFAARPIDYEDRQEYTLLVTATSQINPQLTSSAIIHVDVLNLEDNSPEFLRGSTQLFEVEGNTTKTTTIGRIVAYDADKKAIFYYIIPSCGSEMSSNFSIDQEFGEIVYNPHIKIKKSVRVEICILADSRKELDLSDVFYDSKAKNMQKIMVVVKGAKSEEVEIKRKMSDEKVSEVGDTLQNGEIMFDFNSRPSVYQLESLNFVPASYELGRDMISPEGSVELNKQTGQLTATPHILDTPQGVYIGKLANGQGSRQLHHVKEERKLKYILAMERNEFGANMEKLKRQIREALGSKSMEIYFSEPVRDVKNSSFTSVCFYMTKDNAILDDKQMSSLLSSTNQHIDKIHHIFKVINVDHCTAVKPQQISNDLPMNTLILISIVALLILVLITLIVYICCVVRYRRNLDEKLKTPYYKSPGSMTNTSFSPTSSHVVGYY